MKVQYSIELEIAFLGDNPSPALERGVESTVQDAVSKMKRHISKRLGRAAISVTVSDAVPVHDEPEPL